MNWVKIKSDRNIIAANTDTGVLVIDLGTNSMAFLKGEVAYQLVDSEPDYTLIDRRDMEEEDNKRRKIAEEKLNKIRI